MEIKQYDTVVLKSGISAAVVEILSEDTFIADIGSSSEDWDTITLKLDDIEKIDM